MQIIGHVLMVLHDTVMWSKHKFDFVNETLGDI